MRKRISIGILAICTVFLFASPRAFGAAGHFNYSTGSGTPQEWAGFGNSIMAGYCGLFCSIKSYASYYADSAAAEHGWAIDLTGYPHSGELTYQIYDEMANTHNANLQAADMVLWSAGGNDFLNARDDYGSSCNVAALDQALSDWRADWDLIISLLLSNNGLKSGAIARTMNIYYPDPNRDRQNFCGNVSDFEVFFPRLIAAGDYMCATAEAAGFPCADSITAMNCDEIDANHTIDPNCFDPSGNNFRDPLDVIKYVNGQPTTWPTANNSGMIQSDRTHPGSAGHRYIADAHIALGWADLPGGGCGNQVCDAGETPENCPADCPDVCGDGLCTGTEDVNNCPSDCPDVCGDGFCTGSEDPSNCSADCADVCGDGLCTGSENANNCLSDCPDVCGDGFCTGSEDSVSCVEDCGSVCGDGVCNGSEDCSTCESDCGVCQTCGGNKAACSTGADCCSGNCKNGTCKGN